MDVCCGEVMKQMAGGRPRCAQCGAQPGDNRIAPGPTPYVQPGTEKKPLSHVLPGPMGRSLNGPFRED